MITRKTKCLFPGRITRNAGLCALLQKTHAHSDKHTAMPLKCRFRPQSFLLAEPTLTQSPSAFFVHAHKDMLKICHGKFSLVLHGHKHIAHKKRHIVDISTKTPMGDSWNSATIKSKYDCISAKHMAMGLRTLLNSVLQGRSVREH